MRHLKPSLEIALLGFVRREARHGYAIYQELSDPAGLGVVWQIKLGQLYALLGKLEEQGYITAVLEPQENKPPRKLFHLTEAGEAALMAWLQTPVEHGRALRLEFLIKLYFARQEGAEWVAHLLAAQRAQCRAWLAVEQELIDAEWAHGREYNRLVHQFRHGQIQAMIAWLAHCEEN